MKTFRLLFLTILVWLIGGSVAYATAIGIDILSGSSVGALSDFTAPFPFESTGNTIIPNGYNDNTLWIWDEQQNVILSANLYVDWVADSSVSYVTPLATGYNINAGTVVSSHYVQWDPDGTGRVVATLHFDSDIFGYITTDQALFNSDAALGLPGVAYNNFLNRGLEPAEDSVIIGATAADVDINWLASNPGDWVRLITAYSPSAADPIPEPATFLLLGSGLLGLVGFKKKRKV